MSSVKRLAPSAGSASGAGAARRGSTAASRVSRRESRRGSSSSAMSSTSSVRSSLEGFATQMASGLIRELKAYPAEGGLKVPLHTPICSNHMLQMLLYFNAWFSLAWFGMYVSLWTWKASHLRFDLAFEIISPIVLCLWAVSEPPRLMFGYVGNLREKVPQLAAFFLLTTFPQIPAMVYFLSVEMNQLPINRLFNIMHLCFLVAEFFVGWKAIRDLVKEHTARFCLLREQGKMFVSTTNPALDRAKHQP